MALTKDNKGFKKLLDQKRKQALKANLYLQENKAFLSNEFRGKATQTIHEMNTAFHYRDLLSIYRGIKQGDFIEKNGWLFTQQSPDEPLHNYEKNLLLKSLEKSYKAFIPFAEVEEKKEIKKQLSFDPKKSILYLLGQEIKIARQDRKTNAHEVLEYIFIDNADDIGQEFSYAFIAEDRFKEEDYGRQKDAWRKFHTACLGIQEKIRKGTKEKIDDFLIFNTSKTGSFRINPKYLLDKAKKL